MRFDCCGLDLVCLLFGGFATCFGLIWLCGWVLIVMIVMVVLVCRFVGLYDYDCRFVVVYDYGWCGLLC